MADLYYAENGQWVQAPLGGSGGAPDGTFWEKWVGTQAQYDAIPTKDGDTLYIIIAG